MATIRLAVVADSHLSPPDTPDGFWNSTLRLTDSWRLWEKAVGLVARAGVDAVLLLGDISNFADHAVITRALTMLTALGRPVAVVAGNHDIGPTTNAVEHAAELLKHELVVLPRPVATGLPGLAWFRFAGVPIRQDDRGGCAVDQDADTFDTCDARPTIVLSHYPLIDCRTDVVARGLRYPDALGNAPAVVDALLGHPTPVVVLHGHLHTQHTLRRGHILQLGVPALVEWPHAVTFLTLRAGKTRLSVRQDVLSLRAPVHRPISRSHWIGRPGGWTTSPPSMTEET